MNVSNYKLGFALIFCLLVTGAFSLLWMRQQIYLQASKSKLLEKELASLVELNKRADLCIAKIQNKSMKVYQLNARQILWISAQNQPAIKSIVAFNP